MKKIAIFNKEHPHGIVKEVESTETPEVVEKPEIFESDAVKRLAESLSKVTSLAALRTACKEFLNSTENGGDVNV